ncbi:MAG: hypothetical protein COA91_08760 [Robiginitomaculum sp.]|nr:MAG: hypothetical protein COA91_08760 [Robiginitomaculum sp.]
MATRLRLLAETGDSLNVVSAALQDAIVRVGDIYYDRSGRSLVIITSRYCHETDTPSRIKSGLGLHNVLSVQMKSIDRSDPDAFLVLLSMQFLPAQKPPGGEIRLVFAGGGEIRVACECLEVRLIDIQAARTTKSIPLHPINE